MSSAARFGLIVFASLCLGATASQADQAAPAEVKLEQQGNGWLITDAKGMTLYQFTKDQEPGKSACVAQCAKTWPPLAAPADAKNTGEWTTIVRDDGSKQWAFRGKPLYGYSLDVSPRDSYGDGQALQWSVALKPIATPPSIGMTNSLLGSVLSNTKEMALYYSDKDKNGKSACDAKCAHTWIPVEMPWIAVSINSDWSGIVRADGVHQWAYKGHPLYAFAGDVDPGETSGDGQDKAWHAMVLQPSPPVPAWTTLRASDAGELYADAEGHTLYQHEPRRPRPTGPRVGGPPSSGPALDMDSPQEWKPVLVAADAKPVGNWGIVTNKEGNKQWAYKGLLLFTNLWDTHPGDLHGIRSPDRSWHTIMQSGKPMQGTGS